MAQWTDILSMKRFSIAQGEGDLSKRLELHSNDEMASDKLLQMCFLICLIQAATVILLHPWLFFTWIFKTKLANFLERTTTVG
jgi:hypothetical protein